MLGNRNLKYHQILFENALFFSLLASMEIRGQERKTDETEEKRREERERQTSNTHRKLIIVKNSFYNNK